MWRAGEAAGWGGRRPAGTFLWEKPPKLLKKAVFYGPRGPERFFYCKFAHKTRNPMPKRRFRRAVWLPVALALYLTASYIYLYWKGNLQLTPRHMGIVALSYVLVVALWWVNRRRERAEQGFTQNQQSPTKKEI